MLILLVKQRLGSVPVSSWSRSGPENFPQQLEGCFECRFGRNGKSDPIKSFSWSLEEYNPDSETVQILPFGLGCAIAWGLYNEFRHDPGTVHVSFPV